MNLYESHAPGQFCTIKNKGTVLNLNCGITWHRPEYDFMALLQFGDLCVYLTFSELQFCVVKQICLLMMELLVSFLKIISYGTLPIYQEIKIHVKAFFKNFLKYNQA